jgi:hypothetical protein
MSNVVIISIRWNNGDYSVSLLGDRTVAELKEQLCALTNVMPARQKILGLMASGKPATDQVGVESELSVFHRPHSPLRVEMHPNAPVLSPMSFL